MVELHVFANSGDPDQTPRSVASDLGLHCLSPFRGLQTTKGKGNCINLFDSPPFVLRRRQCFLLDVCFLHNRPFMKRNLP